MRFINGMTILELEELVRTAPKYNTRNEPYEVWVTTGEGISSPVKTLTALNRDSLGSDLLLGS